MVAKLNVVLCQSEQGNEKNQQEQQYIYCHNIRFLLLTLLYSVKIYIIIQVGARAGRLVCARRALCQVDAGLDSLKDLSVETPAVVAPLDLEEWCSVEGARWSGAGEAGAGAGLLRSHLAFRLATVLGAGESRLTILIYFFPAVCFIPQVTG